MREKLHSGLDDTVRTQDPTEVPEYNNFVYVILEVKAFHILFISKKNEM